MPIVLTDTIGRTTQDIKTGTGSMNILKCSGFGGTSVAVG